MKTIYILLTNTGTITSRLIRKFSDLEYTHSCISLDGYNFYSFSRKYTYLILPAGMVIENTDKGGLKRFSNRNCVLYKLDIEDKKYNKLDKVINKMMKNTKLRYNILGLLYCRLGFAFERQNHMFCSEFVCWVLAKSDIIYLEKSRSLYKPSDLMQIDGIEEAYKGTLFELDKFLKSKKEG